MQKVVADRSDSAGEAHVSGLDGGHVQAEGIRRGSRTACPLVASQGCHAVSSLIALHELSQNVCMPVVELVNATITDLVGPVRIDKHPATNRNEVKVAAVE